MIIPSFKHGLSRVPRVISTQDITTTGSQNYTVPAGTIYLEIEMVGGGGGGGAGSTISPRGNPIGYHGGGGGGGGAYVLYTYRGSLKGGLQTGDTINFTVGAGGTAGNSSASGVTGGNTILVSHIRSGNTDTFSPQPTAGGGGRGETECTYFQSASGGAGGVATNGDVNTNGGAGSNGAAASTDSTMGSNGGSGGVNGGSSVFGNTSAAAGGNFASTAGGGGSAPGNGGGGAWSGSPNGLAGTGAIGRVRVKAYG